MWTKYLNTFCVCICGLDGWMEEVLMEEKLNEGIGVWGGGGGGDEKTE